MLKEEQGTEKSSIIVYGFDRLKIYTSLISLSVNIIILFFIRFFVLPCLALVWCCGRSQHTHLCFCFRVGHQQSLELFL